MKHLLYMLVYCTFNYTLVAQITLSGTNYSQDFNQLASGLPQGWSIRTGANSHSLGNDVTSDFVAIPTPTVIGANGTYWKNTTAKFKNFASFKSSLIGNYVQQASEPDRALGVRQSSTLGDPGAAFVLCLANTQALQNFQLSFDLQSLDDTNGERQTIWSVDYGIGDNPSTFSTISTGHTTGMNQVFSNRISATFPALINNQNQKVWIRIVTLSASTNPLNAPNPTRTSSAIDNFSLSYQLMPTPITLSSFTGEILINQMVQLKWTTIEELNNDYFSIERSNNMLDFKEIGKVISQGNSKSEKLYNLIDKQPEIGINYYRLCQVDNDSTKTCFKPIALKTEWTDSGQQTSIYPSLFSKNQPLLLIWTREDLPYIEIHTVNGISVSYEIQQNSDKKYVIRLKEDTYKGLAIVSVWWNTSNMLTQKILIE
ncbi:hypothetical protein QM480_24105 [Flectobacillus sp. DC10W]|uniref:Uncharacterized protein n=1 Tax=Flectobacillus longus TaxID=2984207 RepID=A0ABT6YV27_9BACT|nr:hypothetical protein [Flectobacillus longus]MDI9867449.1 hypothetical protein [Flectobacillus longus]